MVFVHKWQVVSHQARGWSFASRLHSCFGNYKARLAEPIDRVSARDLPDCVHDILKMWIAKKNGHPSFAACVDG
jgi:hypothetical protein